MNRWMMMILLRQNNVRARIVLELEKMWAKRRRIGNKKKERRLTEKTINKNDPIQFSLGY